MPALALCWRRRLRGHPQQSKRNESRPVSSRLVARVLQENRKLSFAGSYGKLAADSATHPRLVL